MHNGEKTRYAHGHEVWAKKAARVANRAAEEIRIKVVLFLSSGCLHTTRCAEDVKSFSIRWQKNGLGASESRYTAQTPLPLMTQEDENNLDDNHKDFKEQHDFCHCLVFPPAWFNCLSVPVNDTFPQRKGL